jgi:hypothetical protein
VAGRTLGTTPDQVEDVCKFCSLLVDSPSPGRDPGGIRTHGLSVQAIKAFASDRAATEQVKHGTVTRPGRDSDTEIMEEDLASGHRLSPAG